MYSKRLLSHYFYQLTINSGLQFANENILNSSELGRKGINDEVDNFVKCVFSVLIANLVLFFDFAARYASKSAEQKANKSAVNNRNNGNDAKNNELDTEVAGYQDVINWLNSFIETESEGLGGINTRIYG